MHFRIRPSRSPTQTPARFYAIQTQFEVKIKPEVTLQPPGERPYLQYPPSEVHIGYQGHPAVLGALSGSPEALANNLQRQRRG